MDVILLEKIRGLGGLGDQVKVRSGYGRNFLVPKGKAVYATASNIKKFESRRAEFEKIAAGHLQAAQARLQLLSKLGAIVIAMRSGEEGKIFGSVGTRDIAAAITQAGVEVAKSEIHLPTGALRQLGEYEITVEFHGDVTGTIKVNIVPEA